MNALEETFDPIDATRVAPRGGYRLTLTFSDGTEGSVILPL